MSDKTDNTGSSADKPDVSCILVASGAPSTIERTLASLEHAGGGRVELIFADNSLNPEKSEAVDAMIDALGGRRVERRGAGRAELWNAAVESADADMLLLLEAGHVLGEGSLTDLRDSLTADPNLAGSYGRAAVIDGEANTRLHPEKGKTGSIFNRLVEKKHFLAGTSCVLLRRSAFLGLFNEVYTTPRAVFLEFMLQVSFVRPFVFLDRTVTTCPVMVEDEQVLEELVKVFVTVLYGAMVLPERSEEKVRKRLSRQLVNLGKLHYRKENYDKAGRFISQAVKIAPTYFKGRRYQFLNFVQELLARGE